MSSVLSTIYRVLRSIFGTDHLLPAPAPVPSPAPPRPAVDAFRLAMNFILGPSRDGAKKDRAPGETFNTNQGVTDMTWAEATRQGIVTGALENMTNAQRDAIYRSMFWNHLGCPGLDPGVAIMLFNDGVLTGTGHAGKMLQRQVGMTGDDVDGMVGPRTTSKANAMDARALIVAIERADDEYMESLSKAPTFINGWERREKQCADLALTLV